MMKTKFGTLSLCLVCVSGHTATAQTATTQAATTQSTSAQSPSSASPSKGSAESKSSANSKRAAGRTLDELRTDMKKRQIEGAAPSAGQGKLSTGLVEEPFGPPPAAPGQDPFAVPAAQDPFASPPNSTPGMGMGSGLPSGMMGGMGGGGMGGGGMMGGGMESGMGGGMGMGGMSPPPSEKQLVGMLIQQLRLRLDSKDHKRETVEKQLRAALQQYFVLDMEERVREFDKVKARVDQMETKLQRRLDGENEIIDLQIKQMLHKADGLDFTIPGYSGYGMGMGGMGGMGMSGGMLMEGMAGMSGTGYAPLIGYDASFSLTRMLRADANELSEEDPLRTYMNGLPDLPLALTNGAGVNTTERIRKLLFAFHQFEQHFHHLPKSASRIFKGHPPHSWRVALLPLIGHAELYKQYQFDQPWDSEINLRVAAQMPDLYRTKPDQKDKTSFLMLVGNGAFDSVTRPTKMVDMTDGTSNTICMIVSEREVLWTQPEDFPYSRTGALPSLTAERLVGMVDGTVRTLKPVKDDQFRAMITIAGGETVDVKALSVLER